MQLLMNVIVVIQILTALAMIGLVLVQHGKGADMGASFGSGASGSLFGASGSANFLSRSTAACATVFFVCTLALAYMANSAPARAGASVLDRAAPSGAASAPAGAQIPSDAAVVAPATSGSAVPAAPAASPAAPAIPKQ